MTYIDGHFPSLVEAYENQVVKPLTSLCLKHIQDCPSPVVEAKFSQLIETNGSWYSLLLAIDFEPGDTLPFSTALWCLPKESPDAVVNSKDDYEMGDIVIMKQQLHKFPWQSYGLTTDIVAPALHAIKTLQIEDKALFLHDTHVKEILQLGLRAFRNKEAGYAHSSNASDGSAKRSHSSDGKCSTSKKWRTMEIDSDAFTKSVSTKKKGKARRLPPVYTSDEDNDELGGDSPDVVSHDVGL